MHTLDAIRRMLDKSGQSARGVSEAIGRHSTYLSMSFGKNAVPRVDSLAKVAEQCGYRIVLESDDDRIYIDDSIGMCDRCGEVIREEGWRKVDGKMLCQSCAKAYDDFFGRGGNDADGD